MDVGENMVDAANYEDFSEEDVPALEHDDTSGDEHMSDGEHEANDNATQDDSDSNSDADYPAPVPMPRRMRIFGDRRIGLPEFLRMIAPLHVPPMAPGESSNEQLIQQLKNSSNMKCKRVVKAFQVVSRDLFVPEDQLQDAFYDRPLRLDSDFNISAPHMHACMTEALNIQPGDKVLDIGSGCGVTTAICAFLAGKEGQVVGLEVRDVALALSAKGLQAVMAKPEFTSVACVPTFEKCNAFIAPHHEGLYDKVHVGGSCPEDKVSTLLRMLKPDHGFLVVPAGQNLLRFTRQDGQTKREVLAAVRFGELELPTESAIVLGHLQRHRFKVSSPPKEESPYQHEMSAVLFGESPVPELLVEEKDDEHFSICGCSGMLHSPLTRTSPSTPMSRNGRTYSTSSSGSGSSFPLPTSVEGVLEGLGPPDCTIVGTGFKFPAHSAVLKARCMLLRARFASGMADSNDDIISMPPHFDANTVQICLDHLYHDKTALDDANAVRVLHAASYLGVPHLVTLCQGFIIKHLQTQPLREALDSAAELHMFASENGLDALRTFCASFQAMHISLARSSPAYSRLGPRELDEIIRALATEHDVILTQLRQLSGDMQATSDDAAAQAPQVHAL